MDGSTRMTVNGLTQPSPGRVRRSCHLDLGYRVSSPVGSDVKVDSPTTYPVHNWTCARPTNLPPLVFCCKRPSFGIPSESERLKHRTVPSHPPKKNLDFLSFHGQAHLHISCALLNREILKRPFVSTSVLSAAALHTFPVHHSRFFCKIKIPHMVSTNNPRLSWEAQERAVQPNHSL